MEKIFLSMTHVTQHEYINIHINIHKFSEAQMNFEDNERLVTIYYNLHKI